MCGDGMNGPTLANPQKNQVRKTVDMSAEARTWRAFFKMHSDITNLKDARVLPNRLMVGTRISYEGGKKLALLEVSLRELGADKVFLAVSCPVDENEKHRISVSGALPNGQEISKRRMLSRSSDVRAFVLNKLKDVA